MAELKLKGNLIHTSGELPKVGSHCPEFQLTQSDLTESHLKDFTAKNLILNIFPSLDTAVCAQSVRTFNQHASSLPDTQILCISMDLPFAHNRFCTTEGIKNVITLSAFRHPEFATQFGIKIIDGPLAKLLARSVIVLDEKRNVIYIELVPEITQEPNYQKVLDLLM